MAYSIYIDKRPLRIAFLIDPTKASRLEVNATFKYNMGKWGGRFNPIILTDGKNIDDNWWRLLRVFDPDVIKSLVPLEDKLVQNIDHFLSPYSVEVAPGANEDTEYHLRIDDDPLSILPTAANVEQISRTPLRFSKVVVFKLAGDVDEAVRSFIQVNFGIYHDIFWMDSTGDMNEKRVFEISDRKTLATALTQLSTFESFVYPIQFCSLPNPLPDVQHDGSEEVFSVVLGNTTEDLVQSWNRSLSVAKWKRTHLSQAWVPTELLNDAALQEPLRRWLERRADPGGQGAPQMEFVSTSLKEEELGAAVSKLTRGTWSGRCQRLLSGPEIPAFYDTGGYLSVKDNMDLYRGTASEEHIVLKEPDVRERTVRGEHWMADLYIQYWPDRYRQIHGMDFWWQLPPRNQLAHDMFRRACRICSRGFPSVLMRRGEPELTVRLPDDRLLFYSLIVGGGTHSRKMDPRAKLVHRPFYDVRRSDKGRYLSGLLSVFRDLWNAYHVLEQKYWRRMFDRLSPQAQTADKKRLESIQNKLKKILRESSAHATAKAENLKRLSTYVLQLSREQASAGKELAVQSFEEEAQKELEEFNSTREPEQKFEYNEEFLNGAMRNLIESNILLLGIRSHCPRCGYATWYHIDEAKQTLQCKGCGYGYSIRPQEKWYYKLNSLVQAGCAVHGLTPVVLLLGELLETCRSSFIFLTSMELLKKDEDTAFGEIDVLCIQDGKFIIGEVKQSVDLFTKRDFEKMAEIATLIKPHVLLFSSLDRTPSKSVTTHIERIKKQLAHLEIDVRWHQLSRYAFEARPVG